MIAQKIQNINKAIKLFLISLLLIWSQLAYAVDNAALLPNGMQTFLDQNGNPLSEGKVYFYIPTTTTFKTTWIDSDEVTPNTNPVTLDSAGRAVIYGEGKYRQILKDKNNDLIWDKLTFAIGTGAVTTIGDGNLVGTVLPWAGLVAPSQYVFAYGQELSRTTYSSLLTALTTVQSANCTSGSSTLTGLTDTSQIPIGAKVEASCAPTNSTVVSKTLTSVVISASATSSVTTATTFFPFGNGNSTTTFNVPDLRGNVPAGRDNMGGVAASRLTTTYFGSNASAIGATGGNESHSVAITQGLATAGAVAFNNLTPIVVPTVQPTLTLNYVIKVLPDTSSNLATGVFSIQGMTGVLTCGPGLSCTGNVLDTVAPTASVTLVGTGWGLTGGPCTVTCTVSVATTNPAFQFGNVVNAQLNATVATSALTIALKANDGTDGTATNPILIPFRNVSLPNGSPTWLALTSSLSLTVPSTATLGTANATPFRIWIAAVNDAGTIRLCVINTLSGTSIYPLTGKGILTSLGTPASATQTFYCGSVVTSKAYTLLGYITYESGLATAGTWSAIPDVIQLYGPGVALPGEVIQRFRNIRTTGGSLGTTAIPNDDTIPQITEGNATGLSQAITPISAANVLKVSTFSPLSAGAAATMGLAMFRDSNVNAVAATVISTSGSDATANYNLVYEVIAGSTASTTFTTRAGTSGGNQVGINGSSAARIYGGAMYSWLLAEEIMQ